MRQTRKTELDNVEWPYKTRVNFLSVLKPSGFKGGSFEVSSKHMKLPGLTFSLCFICKFLGKEGQNQTNLGF